eukprot:IDg23558t1
MLDAHVAKHGEVETKFEVVLNAFCAHYSFIKKHEESVPAPKLRTLRDRFTKLVANRRALNKKNVAASGIEEVHGELEQNLDNIIQEMDDKKQSEAEAKEKVERKEQDLLDAGISIRQSAMKRTVSPSIDAESPKKKQKKIARATIDLTGDREFELMEEEARHRRDTDKKRLELEERRIALAEENQKAQLDLMRALIA